ncbi:hypothetical protein KUTeg_009715 [Tegillarca granosa]|uniref:Uncharacterized protein n=1 Tax=Tegillarca granosa TaxID=220873 RepID=A0ABQ9F8Y8_TEGGR|nr:hypothetical protein KUTeg_009715 [Tegillarca granosa]
MMVVLISFIVACLCSKSMTKTSEIAPLKQVQLEDNTIKNKYDAKIDLEDIKCPDESADEHLLKEKRHRIQLDKKLRSLIKVFISGLLYLTLLCIMVSHHMVSQSYDEKKYLGTAIKSDIQTDTINGIWDWIENSFIDKVFPKRWYNGELRSAYLQRFIDNGYSFRLGLARACEVPNIMKKALHICQRDYNVEYEEKGIFCPVILITNSFAYSSSGGELKTDGLFAVYGVGGYSIELGPQRDLALSYVRSLRRLTWIDPYTRALFVEVVTMNGATRLHSVVKMTFELSSFGDINIKSDIMSSNLYPYLGPWDYIILMIQLIFILITIVRIVRFVISVYKLKINCLVTSSAWIELLRLVFCVTAIILYILRIDSTLSAIKQLSDNVESLNSFVSIEKVQMLDKGYRMCLSVEVFLATLDLLKPLTFNYYLHLMRTSLVISCGQIISAALMVYLLIVAFATLLYLLVGPYIMEMRDMVSALMTMTRLSLTIAKFKNTLEEMDSLELEVIFMIFMTLMTFIIINLFVAVVSTMFGLMKTNAHNLESVEGFDAELNNHFWWKLNRWFSRITDFLCLRNHYDFDNKDHNQRLQRYSDIFLDRKIFIISVKTPVRARLVTN